MAFTYETKEAAIEAIMARIVQDPETGKWGLAGQPAKAATPDENQQIAIRECGRATGATIRELQQAHGGKGCKPWSLIVKGCQKFGYTMSTTARIENGKAVEVYFLRETETEAAEPEMQQAA